jgi:hypothetical protein
MHPGRPGLRRARPRPDPPRCHPRTRRDPRTRPGGRSCREPLDTADKRTSRVLSAARGAPLRRLTVSTSSPHADFGPAGAFVGHQRSPCSHGSPRDPPSTGFVLPAQAGGDGDGVCRGTVPRTRPIGASLQNASQGPMSRWGDGVASRAPRRSGAPAFRRPIPRRCVLPACVSGTVSRHTPPRVIPAQAGIHAPSRAVGPSRRRTPGG